MEPITLDEHLYTADHGAACDLAHRVNVALAADHTVGAFRSGGLIEVPAVPGYVVGLRRHYDAYVISVDHAGPGRVTAIEHYAAALRGAGFIVAIRPWPYRRKPVIFVTLTKPQGAAS